MKRWIESNELFDLKFPRLQLKMLSKMTSEVDLVKYKRKIENPKIDKANINFVTTII